MFLRLFNVFSSPRHEIERFRFSLTSGGRRGTGKKFYICTGQDGEESEYMAMGRHKNAELINQ